MSRILVIDDDVHIGNILEELLTREGHTVLRAYSGTEAVLSLDAARPDLVLLDLMLPGLTGEQVLPKIQGIPVIVLSAKADVDSKVSLLLSGAADYVTKPFDSRELMARVAAALRKTAPAQDAPLAWGAHPPGSHYPAGIGGGDGSAPDPHGVRHSSPADAKPLPGDHQIPAFRARQRRHAGLYRELPQDPRQQSAEKAPGRRGGRSH